MTASLTSYQDLAARHLPADAAARWIALLRPGVGLREADGTETAAATLGGEPMLPVGTPWPRWPEHGPLSFIASVDCAALPRQGLDAAFPTDGTLLFFYFDGQVDDGDALVWAEDPETSAGARVLYIPAGTGTAQAATPDALEAYPRVRLAATVRCTVPDPWRPGTLAALSRGGTASATPWTEPDISAFLDAVDTARSDQGTRHQIGGHPVPVQGPVEHEIARAVLGPGASPTEEATEAEARRWVLLAQIDTDAQAHMMWGDCGTLYWLIRPEDLAARRFEEEAFTWQCS